jgi:hypothetical protein
MPATVLLEFSEDDLSDTTPTYVDVTSYCRGIEWWSGIDTEGDEPQPGGAVIRMRSTNRDWEPDYTGGRFYPNVTTYRRFRLTVNGVAEGIFYTTGFAIDYPAGTGYSEVTITCADGFEVLALDNLPLMDPPDADSYSDVVDFDEPWGYWRLGEEKGTQVVNKLRTSKKIVGKGKKRRVRRKSRWLSRVVGAEVESSSGPTGVYKNNPQVNQPGLILGDPDTAVTFTPSPATNYVRIPLEQGNTFSDDQVLTVECWAKITSDFASVFVAGPSEATANESTFLLNRGVNDRALFRICYDGAGGLFVSAEGTTTLAVGSTYHLVGTWGPNGANVYVNGALEGTNAGTGPMLAATNNNIIGIAGDWDIGGGLADATIDEVAIYERELTADRILAHYTAGAARGYPQQTAGTRIADIVTHALWSEASIQTSGRNLQPVFKHGQPKLEEISESMHAEGPQTLFFFNGSGDPVYLGHEWKATASAYNTVQATFGDGSGEIPYENVELVYDNETFNEVTTNREGGTSFTAEVAGVPRRANSDFTDVLLANDNETESLAGAVLDFYKTPALRPATLTVNGVQASTQIGARKIGHLVRVKRRGQVGGAIDRVTHIIGYRKSLGPEKHLTCTWNLARGFDATLANNWRAGIAAFSEAGQTTRAA